MGYAFYVFVSLVEGTLFYVFLGFVCKLAHFYLPPLGSSTFTLFLVTWPLTANVVRPGLHSIPIIGDAFAILSEIAKSGFANKD